MPKIKAILFDADGVLTYPREEYFSETYARERGIDINESGINVFFNKVFPDILVGKKDLKDELGKVIEDWSWDKGVDEFLEYWFKTEANPWEEVIDYAKEIRDGDIKIFIGTNNEKYRTEYIREDMGFGKIFDKIYSSGELGHAKPDAMFFEYILNKNRLKPSEVFFVDDDIINVRGAKKVGIDSLVFKNLAGFKKEIINRI